MDGEVDGMVNVVLLGVHGRQMADMSLFWVGKLEGHYSIEL
jgi:hypothetical protein